MYDNSAILDPSFTLQFRTYRILPLYVCKLSHLQLFPYLHFFVNFVCINAVSHLQLSPSIHYFVHFISCLCMYVNSAIFNLVLPSTISYISYFAPVRTTSQSLFRAFRISPLYVCQVSRLRIVFTPLFRTFCISSQYVCKFSYFFILSFIPLFRTFSYLALV